MHSGPLQGERHVWEYPKILSLDYTTPVPILKRSVLPGACDSGLDWRQSRQIYHIIPITRSDVVRSCCHLTSVVPP